MGDYYLLAGVLCILASAVPFVIAVVWVRDKKKELKQKWEN